MTEPGGESEGVGVGGQGRNRGAILFDLHAKLSIAVIELSDEDFARVRNANGPDDFVALADNTGEWFAFATG